MDVQDHRGLARVSTPGLMRVFVKEVILDVLLEFYVQGQVDVLS